MQRRETDTSTLASGSSVRNGARHLEHDRGSNATTMTAGDFGAGRHNGKRQKTGEGGDQHGGGVDSASTARKRKRLLADAAKISTGEDSLKSFLELVTCVQAKEILKVVHTHQKEPNMCSVPIVSAPHTQRLVWGGGGDSARSRPRTASHSSVVACFHLGWRKSSCSRGYYKSTFSNSNFKSPACTILVGACLTRETEFDLALCRINGSHPYRHLSHAVQLLLLPRKGSSCLHLCRVGATLHRTLCA